MMAEMSGISKSCRLYSIPWVLVVLIVKSNFEFKRINCNQSCIYHLAPENVTGKMYSGLYLQSEVILVSCKKNVIVKPYLIIGTLYGVINSEHKQTP